MKKPFFCFIILLLLIGCRNNHPEVLKPTFSSISKLILSKKCALHTCHSSAFAKESADLELMNKSSYYDLVNVKSKTHPDILRIKPGDPDNSLIINRLDGTVIVATPLERTSITEDEINIIRKWIKDGALNN